MSKDQVISGFIIKSQDLGEADLLLTFFSQQQGKVRAVVKSAKKMTSKLSGNLQPFNLIEVTLVGNGGLPKIIGANPINKYPAIIASQSSMQALLAMQELVQRALADEQANPELFEIYQNTLQKLQTADESTIILILTQFYCQTLLVLGFSPRLLDEETELSQIFFSIQNGRFLETAEDNSDLPVPTVVYQLFKQLSSEQTAEIANASELAAKLLNLLTRFASYQLERELRATRYFLL